jgi:hypothetical protein
MGLNLAQRMGFGAVICGVLVPVPGVSASMCKLKNQNKKL